MITAFLGIIYGVGLGITLAIILTKRVIVAYLRINSSNPGPAKTVLKIVFWPITWATVFKSLWTLYKEEKYSGRRKT